MYLNCMSGSEWSDFNNPSQLLPWSPIKAHSSIYSTLPTTGQGMWTGWPFTSRAHSDISLPVIMLHTPQFAKHLCHLFRDAAASSINLVFIFAIDPYVTAINVLVCYDMLQLLFKRCSSKIRTWSSSNNTFTHVAFVDAAHQDVASQLLIWLINEAMSPGKKEILWGGTLLYHCNTIDVTVWAGCHHVQAMPKASLNFSDLCVSCSVRLRFHCAKYLHKLPVQQYVVYQHEGDKFMFHVSIPVGKDLSLDFNNFCFTLNIDIVSLVQIFELASVEMNHIWALCLKGIVENGGGASMCAIITPFCAEERAHKRQEPSGGRVFKFPQYTRVCCGSKLDLDVFTLTSAFSRAWFSSEPAGPQTPKAWQLWWLVTFGVFKNVCSSRGCHKSETGTACSKETLHLQTSFQQPACSYYHVIYSVLNMTATIINECVVKLLKVKTVPFHLQTHNLFELQNLSSTGSWRLCTCIFMFLHIHEQVWAKIYFFSSHLWFTVNP